jgi:hypothetical protein
MMYCIGSVALYLYCTVLSAVYHTRLQKNEDTYIAVHYLLVLYALWYLVSFGRKDNTVCYMM